MVLEQNFPEHSDQFDEDVSSDGKNCPGQAQTIYGQGWVNAIQIGECKNFHQQNVHPPQPQTDYPTTEQSPPETDPLQDIIEIVANYIEGDWSSLAKTIGLSKKTIDKIREIYCGNEPKEAVREMTLHTLRCWRDEVKGGATLESLIGALKTIKRGEIIAHFPGTK